MSCSKSFKICFYGTGLKQVYKRHCNNNFLKEHRSKGYEHLTLFIDGGASPWDKSIQGTPPFTGHQIRSRKNIHIIFVSITLVLNGHLFRGKGQFFWARKPGFNLDSGDTLALKKWLTTKRVDIFELMYSTHNYESFHKVNFLTWIDVMHLCEFSI